MLISFLYYKLHWGSRYWPKLIFNKDFPISIDILYIVVWAIKNYDITSYSQH